ncbi:hypothetical protein PHYSODRAFT_293744 [Phytophthora sojae]|uniref:Uncharacterized protein n=1 Tax=Phytophthora sojae (strain P6497) TaxID=1094619 RepID=G4YIL2_PHYSP|nr:hypothetical protein PHYSODRAFT_293744 [Phytophthora sojae]EGZ28136.1 hypothetical protein PHYSODRAFT_293744 [Phytophthora sojae]|eukprot:XP_009515411.1 hypothetical protein PHYSODRAFT_293744 [Phytophthora sojae]
MIGSFRWTVADWQFSITVAWAENRIFVAPYGLDASTQRQPSVTLQSNIEGTSVIAVQNDWKRTLKSITCVVAPLRRPAPGQRVPEGISRRLSTARWSRTPPQHGADRCQFRFVPGGLTRTRLPHRDLVTLAAVAHRNTMKGSSSSSVQTLIDQFELMAQANAEPAAPRSWSVAGSKRTALPPQPTSDNSPIKEIIYRLNTQRARARSDPVQIVCKPEETHEVAEPAEEQSPEEEAESKPETPIKPVVYKSLTVKTLQSDDEDDAKTLNSYDGESDADSTATIKSTRYSIVPSSPSSFSTASTGSLDSLLSSLDMFLPEFLQASGETSSETSKIVKPAVYRSRRSSLPENPQSKTTSKLIPPTAYRRASLTGKSSSSTKETGILAAPKPRRSSLYTAKNPVPVASTPARPRRASLSATMVPPAVKSARRFSESARGAQPVDTSPRARTRSNSTSVPRYMDYDSSPRFAATKARNLERRRQLEECNRNLAADKGKQTHTTSKTPRRPRTPEWQGRLDQVRSRLFDSKEDNKSRAPKATSTRRHSTSSRV